MGLLIFKDVELAVFDKAVSFPTDSSPHARICARSSLLPVSYQQSHRSTAHECPVDRQ